MAEEAFLIENKEYDHGESKQLLENVRIFFRKNLKLIVSEWATERKSEQTVKEGAAAVVFFIEKTSAPIYLSCNGYDDLNGILDLFEQRLNGLLDSLDDLFDNNNELDEESKKSLDSYAKAVEKCANVYGTQKRKRMARFKELSTVSELRDELRQLFSEIIANYIIAVLFDALYERVKNNSGQIYEMVISEINGFLAENGVYTKPVSAGDLMDPEYMEPTPDSAENYTDDFQKFDTVDEIYRYPYLFEDNVKVADGRARIWRRRD